MLGKQPKKISTQKALINKKITQNKKDKIANHLILSHNCKFYKDKSANPHKYYKASQVQFLHRLRTLLRHTTTQGPRLQKD